MLSIYSSAITRSFQRFVSNCASGWFSRHDNILKKYSIRFIHKNGEKCILEEENYLRFRKYEVELEGVSEIIIDIAETYGEDVSLFGINIK